MYWTAGKYSGYLRKLEKFKNTLRRRRFLMKFFLYSLIVYDITITGFFVNRSKRTTILIHDQTKRRKV